MISYKPFLKLLIDRNLKKQDIVNAGIVSWATMAKIEKNQNISLEIINRVCSFLKCQPSDLIEHIPDEKD